MITHKRSHGLIDFALQYATENMRDMYESLQVNHIYIEHQIAVAKMVASITDDLCCFAA